MRVRSKKCVECENEFEPHYSTVKLCSDYCRRKKKNRTNLKLEHSKRGYAGYGYRTCIICSSNFKGRNSNNKTCSKPCFEMNARNTKNITQKRKHERDKKKPEYVLARILRTCLYNVVKQKLNRTSKSHKYCDFSSQEFQFHIESLFLPGMNWENWGKWHIDHIKPLSKFDLINEDGTENLQQIIAANSLENLQPLWATDNLKKHNKVAAK